MDSVGLEHSPCVLAGSGRAGGGWAGGWWGWRLAEPAVGGGIIIGTPSRDNIWCGGMKGSDNGADDDGFSASRSLPDPDPPFPPPQTSDANASPARRR